MRVGYTRVSTDKQTLFQSIEALEKAGCQKVFSDFAVSAVAKKRPGLTEARQASSKGDTFVVLAIDRAFRSTIEGLTFLDELHHEGVTFHSIWQNLDTSTPEGRKWFTYAVADAEYERSVTSRRTKLAMQAAKARGVKFGRTPLLSSRQVQKAQKLWHQGVSITTVAKILEVSRTTAHRAIHSKSL